MRDRPFERAVRRILRAALREDIGAGDVTSRGIFGPGHRAAAVIRSKQRGVLAGSYLLRPLFMVVDKRVSVTVALRDGASLHPGSEIARIAGPVRAILAGERTALNFLQRLSGIATRTAALRAAMGRGRAVLLDTRKTTPLLRALEKRAVVAGGGRNHRHGLYDMVLIKDTHVRAAGGVAMAIRRVRSSLRRGGRRVRIEAEVQSLGEFRAALAERPDIIMLDNMSLRDMRRCVGIARRAGSRVLLEASGNISEATIGAVARTGVDRISAGCVTHSAPALDIHLVIL